MRMREDLLFDCDTGPFGRVLLVTSNEGLVAALWNEQPSTTGFKMIRGTHPTLTAAKEQLAEYFAGTRKHFDLPLAPRGTPFQLRAWSELQRIPFGKTISYGEQARRLGDTRYARAVGGANGRNPIAIIIPCHRVIGKNGSLTGFAYGTDMKQSLLLLEQTGIGAGDGNGNGSGNGVGVGGGSGVGVGVGVLASPFR